MSLINKISGLHILIISSWFSNTYNENSGSFVVEQAEILSKAGHKVGFIANTKVFWFYLSRYKKLPKFLFRKISRRGVSGFSHEVLFLPAFPRLRLLNRAANFINRKHVFLSYLCMYWLYRLFNGKPDIIHLHSFNISEFVPYLKKSTSLPVVITEHWSGFLNAARVSSNNFHVQKTYQSVDGVICVSEYLGCAVKNVTGRNFHIIPNSLDFSKFSISDSKEDYFTFIAIGYLVPIKRYDRVVEAFSRIYKVTPDVRLKIVGDGSLRTELENLAESLGVRSAVEFCGFVDRSQIPQVIRKAHVLISSSEVETFGMTLVEAFASGIPVVCIDSGGPRDVVEDEINGYLVGPSVDELAAGMRRIHQKYLSFSPATIRSRALEKFGAEAVSQRLQDYYHSFLNR